MIVTIESDLAVATVESRKRECFASQYLNDRSNEKNSFTVQ